MRVVAPRHRFHSTARTPSQEPEFHRGWSRRAQLGNHLLGKHHSTQEPDADLSPSLKKCLPLASTRSKGRGTRRRRTATPPPTDRHRRARRPGGRVALQAIPRSSLVASHTWLEALRSERGFVVPVVITTAASSDFRSTLHCFPGPLVIGVDAAGHHKLAARGLCMPGVETDLSSSKDTLLTILRPLHREVLWHPLQVLWCRPWPSPTREGLGSSSSVRTRTGVTTLQASLDVAHWSVARPRSAPGLSTTHGGFATGDLGVSPNRTLTGWLPSACRLVTSSQHEPPCCHGAQPSGRTPRPPGRGHRLPMHFEPPTFFVRSYGHNTETRRDRLRVCLGRASSVASGQARVSTYSPTPEDRVAVGNSP